jgi:hypothetical protein
MVKDSAEGDKALFPMNYSRSFFLIERIMQIGKKKLVLDHLIVQKMDDDEDSPGENMESILTHGAQALFDSEQAAKEIVCKLQHSAFRLKPWPTHCYRLGQRYRPVDREDGEGGRRI